MMDFSVSGFLLTCTVAALLSGWNVQGSQEDEWFNVPKAFESDHLRDQSIVNCGEKRFFTMFNLSVQPKLVKDCSQSVTLKGAWIPSEDILYMECYASRELNGVEISTSSQDSNLCHGGGVECPMLKGKLYEVHGVTSYPLPCVMNEGDYKLKAYCKNQDDDIIFCIKWTFTWV